MINKIIIISAYQNYMKAFFSNKKGCNWTKEFSVIIAEQDNWNRGRLLLIRKINLLNKKNIIFYQT